MKKLLYISVNSKPEELSASKTVARKFINKFLDHFIGWNFGVSVNRNEKLKAELESLNEKVINMGLREYAGTGYEVYGIETEEHNGLQHFYLPTEKGQAIKHTKKGE